MRMQLQQPSLERISGDAFTDLESNSTASEEPVEAPPSPVHEPPAARYCSAYLNINLYKKHASRQVCDRA